MSRRAYDGPALDATYQHITERPSLEREKRDDGDDVDDELDAEAETVLYATDPEPQGEERAENVPIPEEPTIRERPDIEGQSTLEDFRGGSA